jgi:starch phosphorylase
MSADEVARVKREGYAPRRWYEGNAELREALDQIGAGVFSKGDRDLFRPLVGALLDRDEYLLLADYPSYIECQERVSAAYRDRKGWTRMSILNVARMGTFSSDRSIRDYCEKVWNIVPGPSRRA